MLFYCFSRDGTITAYLEKLNSNAGEHEVQKHGDQDNVANALNGNKHTLDDML